VSTPQIANAPLSYGAFEYTVGTAFPVPDPQRVLGEIASAGYAGTDLGPPGFFGTGEELRDRLETHGLDLVGGFVPIAFSERTRWDEGFAGLHATLDAFDAAGSATARPVLCDAGGPERLANPGRGGEDPSLELSNTRWITLTDGVGCAADVARERGYEPVFHHHTSTYVESVGEVERLLTDTDIPLLLDSAHVLVAGGDPLDALTDWGGRIEAVHVKDVRLDVLAGVKTDRADTITAWRRGLFCPLGAGDVDLAAFCAALAERGYDGWLVVEQDRVLADLNGSFDAAAAEQVANREWLKERMGW
jgi:inosose dehydratase